MLLILSLPIYISFVVNFDLAVFSMRVIYVGTFSFQCVGETNFPRQLRFTHFKMRAEHGVFLVRLAPPIFN